MRNVYDVRNNCVKRRSIKRLVSEGIVPLGIYMSIPSPSIAEYAALAGFDYVMIDAEHHLFNLETIAHITRACDAYGIATTIRTSQKDAITAMLDFGVTGFRIPHVHSAEEVKELVTLIKYAPVGSRGFCSGGRAECYGTIEFNKYYKRAKEENFLMVMIEDEEGIKNMDEILAVPGLDYVAVGPGDISQSLGHISETKHPEVLQMIDKIYKTADKYGVLYPENGAPVNVIDDKSIILSAMIKIHNEERLKYNDETWQKSKLSASL